MTTEDTLAEDYSDFKQDVHEFLMDLRRGEDDYGPWFKIMLDEWTMVLGMKNYVPEYTGPTAEGTCLRLDNGSIAVLVGSNSVDTPWSVIDMEGRSDIRMSHRDVVKNGYTVLAL